MRALGDHPVESLFSVEVLCVLTRNLPFPGFCGTLLVVSLWNENAIQGLSALATGRDDGLKRIEECSKLFWAED